MGIDIHGFVEVGYARYWAGVVSVGALLHRSDDLFGCLFGVNNHAGFEPLFADRGLPSDPSEETLRLIAGFEDAIVRETHAFYSEILTIDQSAIAARTDRRLMAYEIGDDGTERFVGKVGGIGADDEVVRREIAREGRAVSGGRVYRAGTATVAEALDHRGWRTLTRLMNVLADEFDHRVRLVVWFS